MLSRRSIACYCQIRQIDGQLIEVLSTVERGRSETLPRARFGQVFPVCLRRFAPESQTEDTHMLKDLFFELVDRIDSKYESKLGSPFLQELANSYGLSNVAYLGINIPGVTESKVYGVTTYSPEWVARYISENYVEIDPVVKFGMAGLLPFDWQSVRGRNKRVDRFFGEAAEFGVGLQGLSFPIRGAHGETALFSINSHSSDREWSDLKRTSMRDFQVLAYHFHMTVLENEGVMFEQVALTAREKECLKWAAAGKTAWETGKILGVRDGTVEFYIDQARVKLAAMNKVQAVAKAIRIGAI